MEMYTSLRGAVTLKKEFIKIISILMNEKTSNYEYDNLINQYDFLKRWEEVERGSIYMLGGELFQFPLGEKEELFKHRLVGDTWYFTSCIKDYMDERTGKSPFDVFLESVIPTIVKEILILETASEVEQDFGFRQWYIDSESKSIKSNFIHFNEWDYAFEPFRIAKNKDIFEIFKKEHGLQIWSSNILDDNKELGD
ncbi:hypothetical protein ACFSJM_08695 [Lactococcus formosensis subsp. bovis]|uniref:hypothetical protein n=1 Tax=Lactococcus formosensis TaxID=1281486 RepID=UPI001BCB3EEA|nr:hypothetical protein [Lactococcus formosensis]